MDKYNRNYVLFVQKRDGTVLRITRPFTVEFDITRNSLSSANVSQIRVYNLSPDNRNQIRKDQFDFGDLRSIEFRAGYGDKLSVAFKGNITQAWSVREGTNMITQIESFDGGYAFVNAVTNNQFKGGTPQRSIIESLASSLPGATVGAIGNYEGQITRGNSYSGSTTDLLKQLSGGGFFIDNGKVNVIRDDECLDLPTILVNSQSGLLGTPIKETTYINFDMLFEPSIAVAQLIRLESVTADHFNGIHKVLSVKHRGTISEAVCGTAVSSVGLLPGTFTAVAQRGANG